MIQYYLIIGLQVYCIYHLFKNKNSFYWFYLILFIPLLGSLVYIFTQVINGRDVSVIKDEVANLINPTKKILELEKKLEFSSTFQNQVNLADAYLEIKDYSNAIQHYEKALDSNFKNDIYTINQLIKAYFSTDNFDKVIEYSEKIKSNLEFKKSQFFYGIALEHKERFEEAEIELQKIDLNYSNYKERLFLSEFLIRRNKNTEAKELLEQMVSEALNMTPTNKRTYRPTIERAQTILNGIG
tara:strand:- start:18044 stop:18766 length:723 start_codon:yes stop_codon:yes gene_type:complete